MPDRLSAPILQKGVCALGDVSPQGGAIVAFGTGQIGILAYLAVARQPSDSTDPTSNLASQQQGRTCNTPQ